MTPKSTHTPDLFAQCDLTRNESNIIVVWFSCGAASAVAAKKTIEMYGAERVRVVNNMVIEEDSDNRRFLRDVEAWIGVKIEDCYNPSFPGSSAVSVWDKMRGMSFLNGAPCTGYLKKEARYHWERNNRVGWHVLGFVKGEELRHENFILSECENVLPILIDAGITKADCYRILKKEGIDLPRTYAMGYPNANCIGCVKSTSPTYWNLVRKNHPDIFEHRAIQSRRLGSRLVRVKGVRIFLDELDPEAKGQPLKNMDFECGIFCAPETIITPKDKS